MSSLNKHSITTPGQQRRAGQRIIISSAAPHGTPPPPAAAGQAEQEGHVNKGGATATSPRPNTSSPAPTTAHHHPSHDGTGPRRGTTSTTTATPHVGSTASRTAASNNAPSFTVNTPSSAGAWGPLAHNKCLTVLDNLLHSMRTQHDQDKTSATEDGTDATTPRGAATASTTAFGSLHQQEANELHLISTALHQKDIVGLFSLLTVFWSTRNQLVREVQTLEHRLSCPVGHQDRGGGAADAAGTMPLSSTASGGGAAPIEVVLENAKRRLDDMMLALQPTNGSNKDNAAAAADGSGHATTLLLHREATQERRAALSWHRRVLDHGTLADVVALSVDLQQEYQLAHGKLWQPFRVTTAGGGAIAAEGDALSWDGSVLPAAMLVQSERDDAAEDDGGDSVPSSTLGGSAAAYLAGLRGMVQNALESQGSVKQEVSELLGAYASNVHDYVAPPVLRLLVPPSQSPRGGGTNDEQHLEALLPDAGDINDRSDPLSAVGGASIRMPSSASAPWHFGGGDGDDASHRAAVGAMWRLVKFVPLEVEQGESLLHVLQRAYSAAALLHHHSQGDDSNTSTSEGRARHVAAVTLSQEQLSVRHIFCPVRKCPLVDCQDAWLPPDPRMQQQHTSSSSTASTRTKRYQSLLDAVIRTRMVVAVRIVSSLRSVGPAIKALASQAAQLEKDTLPALQRQVADARQRLWDAEIRHIERRTARKRGDADDGDEGLTTVKGLKDLIINLEARDAYCRQSLTQCGEHLKALVSGDLAALSAMLTVSTAQYAVSPISTDGSGGPVAGVPERVVYVCKELPRGADLDAFADAFGVAVEDLHVFEDVVAGPNDSAEWSMDGASASVVEQATSASPSPPRRRATALSNATPSSSVGIGNSTTALTRRIMVYLPMRVPVANVLEQDHQLTRELEAYAKTYPTFPPNTEILEQLAALRRGDVNTMSALLSASRSKGAALESTSQTAALKRKIDDLQQEATTLLRDGDALRRELRDADAALREKTLALERLAWHTTPSSSSTVAAASASPRPSTRGHGGAPLRRGEAEEEADNDQIGVTGATAVDEFTQENFIARGLTPSQAVNELLEAAAKKDADILTLQASLKRVQREQEQNARSAMLRTSSSSRQKQVADLETIVDGLKNELRDETRRGVELTARCVQLEQLNESLVREVSAVKEERSAASAALQKSKGDVVRLHGELRDAQARAHTAERDATAAQAQRHSERRDTFAAKEIPSGMTPEDFLKFLGIKGVAAELSLAKGPVYDALSNTHFLYVPVQVERTSWSHEDLRLQAEIEAASAALVAVQSKQKRQAVDASGSRDLLPASASHHRGPMLHAELLEQLSALRNGDSVALSALLRTYRAKLDEFTALYGGDGHPDASSGFDSPTGMDSLREEDDLAWSTIREGRAKVTLLRAALRHADAERLQWKALCEEYQESEAGSSARLTSLEDAKQEISQRLNATQLLLESRDKEVSSLKARISGLDDDLQRSQRRLAEAAEKATRENDGLLEGLKQQLDEAREAHHAAVIELQQRVDHDARTIAALRNALDEMGVELVADE